MWAILGSHLWRRIWFQILSVCWLFSVLCRWRTEVPILLSAFRWGLSTPKNTILWQVVPSNFRAGNSKLTLPYNLNLWLPLMLLTRENSAFKLPVQLDHSHLDKLLSLRSTNSNSNYIWKVPLAIQSNVQGECKSTSRILPSTGHFGYRISIGVFQLLMKFFNFFKNS